MRDRNVEFPNRFRLVKVEGTDDIYDLEAAPGEVVEEGTLLNKANLLTDETAALLGMEQENPTVNEAFENLRNSLTEEQKVYSNTVSGYASDLYLYITGKHPILCAHEYSDYAQWEAVKNQKWLKRTISLTGDAQTITVYDGG